MNKFQVIAIGQSNMGLNQPNIETSLKRNYGADNVVLTKCSVGGSSIAEWQPGTPNFVNAVNKVKANQALGYEVKGLFMVHGERDARIGTPQQEYTDKMINTLEKLHAAIGLPSMPIIYAQLGALPSGFKNAKWQAIRWAQHYVLQARPFYKMFQTISLGPYENEPPFCHYHDNIKDTAWVGTGYKEITWAFMSRFFEIYPPEN